MRLKVASTTYDNLQMEFCTFRNYFFFSPFNLLSQFPSLHCFFTLLKLSSLIYRLLAQHQCLSSYTWGICWVIGLIYPFFFHSSLPSFLSLFFSQYHTASVQLLNLSVGQIRSGRAYKVTVSVSHICICVLSLWDILLKYPWITIVYYLSLSITTQIKVV